MTLSLTVSLLLRKPRFSPLHAEAGNCLDFLVQQYPLHLYPIVAKALELAYLKPRLSELVGNTSKVVEIAVGDGTLSRRLFPSDATIAALDLNPYSLVKALRFPHIRRAVVCDGLNPPLRDGAFEVLLAVNLLNHVTDKESTLSNWARAACTLLFTENTRFWATAWPAPYAAKRLGLRSNAEKRAKTIAESSMQQLEPLDVLTRRIGSVPDLEIVARNSFLSERTFFYSSVFSLLMRCYGPPTPPRLKRLLLGPLRWCTVPLTKKLAELLIRMDAMESRTNDTFVAFVCTSRVHQPTTASEDFVCPQCIRPLAGASCDGCGAQYQTRDGMLFLLPEPLRFIADEYSSTRASEIPAEHL